MVTDPVRDNDNNNNMAPLKWRDRLFWQNEGGRRRAEMEVGLSGEADKAERRNFN